MTTPDEQLYFDDGPVTITWSDTDPGDIGEPRIVSADGETFVVVPKWSTIAAIEHAAVRAALTGLRAEVASQQAGPRAWNGASELVIERAVTLALIDARLADLT